LNLKSLTAANLSLVSPPCRTIAASLCFWNKATTIREDGRRKLRPHTFAEGERTRVVIEGRLPARSEPIVLYRRVTDPAMYFGQTLRLALKQRRIRVGPRVKAGVVPPSAVLLASYDSDELSDIIRDMNKVSSNFIAEMLVKTLGAEIKGAPGTWPKGTALEWPTA